MIVVECQFLLNVLCASVSVGGIVLILKIFSKWIDKNFNLRWKKWLYLFLITRLLIPVNMKIPYFNSEINNLVRNIINCSNKAEININNSSKGFLIPLNINIDKDYHTISIYTICFFVWIIGFLVYFAFTVAGYIIYRHKILSNVIIAHDIHKVASNICTEICLSKTPRIFYSQAKISPMVLGVLKPILLLPKNKYSDVESYFILKHELIHLKQKDNMYKYILQFANAVHWFNPLIYMLVHDAALNLEILCDERVVKNSNFNTRRCYTDTILNSASLIVGKPLKYFTNFQSNKEIMKKRFQNIIKENSRKWGISIFGTVVTTTLLVGVLSSYLLSFSQINNKNTDNPSIQYFKRGIVKKNSDKELNPSETKTTRHTKGIVKKYKNTHVGKGKQSKNITITPTDNVKDILEIQKIIYGFAGAYFEGDVDTVKKYIIEPDKADVYKNNKDRIYISCLKGLDDLQAGRHIDKITSSLEFLTSEMPDSYTYLTIDLVRVKNSWKISWYGLEL